MSAPVTTRSFLVAVLAVVCSLSIHAVGYGQGTQLIYACVDAKGSLRIVAPGTSCQSKETLLTWPAAAAEPVTVYQRTAAVKLVNIPMTVVALCDAPDDIATGGGYWWERDPTVSVNSSCWIEANASCRASGLCGGPDGEDGWAVIAWGCTAPSQAHTMHVYVTCASQP